MIDPLKLALLRPKSRLRVLWAVMLVLPIGLVGFGLSRVSIDTSVSSFLPNEQGGRALVEKTNEFGGDPIVVLLEPKSRTEMFTRTDQLRQLVKLEGQLAKVRGVDAVYGPGTALNQTAGSAQNMLAQIVGRRDGYEQQVIAAAKEAGKSQAEVERLAAAATRRFDERYGTLIVQGMPAGLPTLSNPAFVRAVLFDSATGSPRQQWRVLLPGARQVVILVRPGASADAAASGFIVDEARKLVEGSGLQLTRSTVTGPPAIAAAMADKAQREVPILGAAAILAVGLVLVLMPWSGGRLARLRPLIAALSGAAITVAGFGLIGHPLSLGVVAFLPILLGIGSDFPLYLLRGGSDRSVVLTSLAAAAAFASLAISPLPFVRELGVALAVGLLVTLGMAALLRRRFGLLPSPAGVVPQRAGEWNRSTRAIVAVLMVVVAAAGWAALPGLHVEARPEVLAAGLPALQDANRAARAVGFDGEISVVVRGRDVASPAALRWESQANERIIRLLGDRVHPILSLSDLLQFLGHRPTPQQVTSGLEVVPEYLSSAVLREDRRIGLMIYGIEYDDVAELANNLKDLERALGDPPPGLVVDIVGLPEAASRGLAAVSAERVWLNLAGIGVASLVLFVGLKDRKTALTAVATVLVAAGWSVLLAQLTVGALSPLTVGIGSLVTATGCEFAVMLRHGEGLRLVRTAALAGVVGYLTLAFSDLAVLRGFGLLLAGGVASSFVAALLLDRIVGRSQNVARS